MSRASSALPALAGGQVGVLVVVVVGVAGVHDAAQLQGLPVGQDGVGIRRTVPEPQVRQKRPLSGAAS